ncbi:MAG TPA: MFS transporter [Anaerolineaceae bacterium]
MEPRVNRRIPRLRGVLRSPDFLKLWGGQTISALGSHITGGGLPLLAVITLKATSTQMGILSAVSGVPVLLFSLLAGVWVDRLRRRPILIAADIGRALLLATIPLVAMLGWLTIWQIYIVIALNGILTVVFNTAYRAYLPTLVEPDQIVEGNARLAVSESAAEVVGPGLTGLLVQTITAPMAILLDSLSFVVSVISLGAIHKPEPAAASLENRQTLLQEAREGLSMLLQQPVLRTLTAVDATHSFFGNFIGVLYALYAIRVLHISPFWMGVTIGIGGASSLVGALLAERAAQRLGLGRTLLGTVWIEKLFNLAIPLAASFPPFGLVLLILSQMGDILGTIYAINAISLRQAITPSRLLGRVSASMELITAGVGPLGALLGGVLGDKIGVQDTLFVSIAGMTFAGVWLLLSPIRHLLSIQDQP